MVSGVVRSLVEMMFSDRNATAGRSRTRDSRRRQTGRGGRFSVADVSLGLRTTSQTETLEDRAMLDGDPYGMGGSMPGGMGTSGTGSTTTTTTTTTTTGTSTGTGTTATGTTTGTGMTTTGTFLGSVSGGVLRPGG